MHELWCVPKVSDIQKFWTKLIFRSPSCISRVPIPSTNHASILDLPSDAHHPYNSLPALSILETPSNRSFVCFAPGRAALACDDRCWCRRQPHDDDDAGHSRETRNAMWLLTTESRQKGAQLNLVILSLSSMISSSS